MTRIGRIFTDFLLGYYWNADDADWADFHGFFVRILTIGTRMMRIGRIFTDFLSEYYWNTDDADFY
ncbi:MAG: hypothetical protein RL329_1547 [Bacteroidota bacterium]|jgi:hypothetical protein